MPLSHRIHGYLSQTTLAISLVEILDKLRIWAEKETYSWAEQRQVSQDEMNTIALQTHFLARTVVRLHGMGRSKIQTNPLSNQDSARGH